MTSSHVHMGDNVYIGVGCNFISSEKDIYIGNNVMISANTLIVTGNHRFDVVGKYMIDVHEKRQCDDESVVIEDDVWIGAGVIILKGVTVGRGSVIAAGTVITKSIEPYSVVYNKLEIISKKRFSESEILYHEKKLSNL